MSGESFDFHNPFMKAAIITDVNNREFTRYPLWTFDRIDAQRPGPTRSSEINKMGSLAFVTDITVKQNLSYCPTITVTMNPPFEAARLLIDSPLIDYTRSLIEVQFGYASPSGFVSSPNFEGLVLKPEVSIGTDVTVTLTAQGIGGLSATRDESGVPLKDQSLREVFDALCKKHGMELDTTELEKNGFDELTAFTEKRAAIVQGNLSDWYFMVREARNIGCWVYLDSSDGKSRLKLLSIDGTNGNNPEYRFRLFDYQQGIVGPKNGVFPILGFSTPTAAIYLAAATQKLRLMGTDSNTRETVEVTVDDKSAAPKRVDSGQSALSGKAPEGSFLAVDAGDPKALENAKQEFKASQNNMGIKIEVQTLGIPNLRPGQVVDVAGISASRLDGKYVVFEVTHSLGGGGFDTSFVAYRNVGQLSTRVGGGSPAVDINTQRFNETSPSNSLLRTNTIPVTAKSGLGVA